VTNLTSYHTRAFEPKREIVPHDRVAVPDGRIGNVVGFYCNPPLSVLVMLDSGDTAEYAPEGLQRLG
jgi:hypothetical protein